MLAFALAAVVGIVCAKLIWLQVVDAPALRAAAASLSSNEVAVEARRGTIYDRNGNVLAISVDCTTVYCNPREIEDVTGAASVLAADLGGDASSYVASLSADASFSYVRRKVDKGKAEKLKEDLSAANVRGIYYLPDSKRQYPHGDVGGQVLGVVGTDGDGLSGLELYYNDVLAGTDGTMTMEVGQDGTPVAGGASQVIEARRGTDIVTSLDIDIQEVSEQVIRSGVSTYKAASGSVVVTDPSTGEILAACSTPLLAITDTSTIEEGALSLKPVSSSFEPGSIFKLITMAIGIDDGLITPDTRYSVPARTKVGDDYVRDDDGRDYTMDMTVREVLRRSSNAGTSLIAQETIGADNFAAGISKFGIGQPSGVDFPGESAGIVKARDEYDGASVGAMSFGQSLAFPMMQMVKAVGALANDGTLETPHFLVSKGGEKVAWDSPGTAVSKETADQVTDMMRTVVQEGTATSAQVKGYDVAGKTGTGEQADESGGYAAASYVSSLIGFAPAADAKVLVYVGLNGTPYLAQSSAAVLFSSIMGASLADVGIPPDA